MQTNGSARRAAAVLWAMVPIGLALIVIGLVEVRWWGLAYTDRLFELFDVVKADNGLDRPTLLRGPEGAWELVGLGVISLAFATFAPYVRRGSRSARNVAMVSSGILLLVVVVVIGADAAFTVSVADYIDLLGEHKPVPGATPADFAPLWPAAWYSWFEDVAQGLQALAFLGAGIALAAASLGPQELLAGREEPTDQYGRALRRFVDERRRAAE